MGQKLGNQFLLSFPSLSWKSRQLQSRGQGPQASRELARKQNHNYRMATLDPGPVAFPCRKHLVFTRKLMWKNYSYKTAKGAYCVTSSAGEAWPSVGRADFSCLHQATSAGSTAQMKKPISNSGGYSKALGPLWMRTRARLGGPGRTRCPTASGLGFYSTMIMSQETFLSDISSIKAESHSGSSLKILALKNSPLYSSFLEKAESPQRSSTRLQPPRQERTFS